MARKKRGKKSSPFRGKVANNAKKTKTKGAYGYLRLPQGIEVFQPKAPSRVLLDFMPYKVTDKRHPDRDDELDIATPGSLWWRRPFKVHRNIGSENKKAVCLGSVGKKCPICEARADLIKQNADKEETDALKPSARCLYVVIPKNHKKYEEEPHIMDMSEWLFQNLLTEELEENEDYEIFPDLEEGYTLKIRFKEKSFGKDGKPFPEASRIDFIERKKGYDEDILDDIPNLDEVLEILSYKQLERLFLEIEDEEEDDKNDDEKPWDDEEDGDNENEDLEEELQEMSIKELKKFIKEHDLDIDTKVTKKNKDDVIEEIIEQMEEDNNGDEEERDKENKKKSKNKKGKKNKCPYGYVFGEDLDEYDECEDCEKWDDCYEKSEEEEEED